MSSHNFLAFKRSFNRKIYFLFWFSFTFAQNPEATSALKINRDPLLRLESKHLISFLILSPQKQIASNLIGPNFVVELNVIPLLCQTRASSAFTLRIGDARATDKLEAAGNKLLAVHLAKN